jgi:hypothetical protein
LPFNKTPYFFDFGPWQGKTIHHLTYDEKFKGLGKTYLVNCLDHPILLRNKPDLVTAFRSLDDIYYNNRWQVAWAMCKHGFTRTERKGSKYIHPESYSREERSVLLSCDETLFDQFIQSHLTSHWVWAKDRPDVTFETATFSDTIFSKLDASERQELDSYPIHICFYDVPVRLERLFLDDPERRVTYLTIAPCGFSGGSGRDYFHLRLGGEAPWSTFPLLRRIRQ